MLAGERHVKRENLTLFLNGKSFFVLYSNDNVTRVKKHSLHPRQENGRSESLMAGERNEGESDREAYHRHREFLHAICTRTCPPS